jgi:hypothetical protein
MTGIQAARRLLALAEREELIAVDLLVRAVGCDRRTLLRDWASRQLPVTRIGRLVKVSARLAVQHYFPHYVPSSGHISQHLSAT